MDVPQLKPGVYVVAVSGGVDSMVLLDMLFRQYGDVADVRLVVAHYDHQIREDSSEDRRLVQQVASQYGLPFVYDQGGLGKGASEELARQARYDFLYQTRKAAKARGIILAHHQDDFLETAIHNMLRGTNRRGLSALQSKGYLIRPLLGVSKQELLAYARDRQLQWREDSTNADVQYRRNYIRHQLLSRFSNEQKQQLLELLQKVAAINKELDTKIEKFVRAESRDGKLGRQHFIMLPHDVAREVLAAWLRLQGVAGYDRQMLERLVIAAKTYAPGKLADVYGGYQLVVSKQFLALKLRDR